MKTKITASLILKLNPQEKPYKVWDTDHSGFFIRVSPKGTLTYALRFLSPIDHKDKTFTIGRSDHIPAAEARRIATTKSGDIAAGRDPQLERKLSQAVADRLEASTLGSFMDKKYEAYLRSEKGSGNLLIKDIRSTWGSCYSKELLSFDHWFVTNWRNNRIEHGIKPSTLNRNTALLRALLNKAVEWDVIAFNPMKKVKQLKLDKTPKVRYLDSSEEERLLCALRSRDQRKIEERDNANKWREQRKYGLLPQFSADSYWDYLTPLVLLCMNTGIRRGEAFDLTWENVDLKSKLITIIGASAKNSHTRHIPLSKQATACLEKWASLQRGASGLIFKSPITGARLNNVYKSWESLKKSADIISFRFHDLRHHFASTLVMRGVELNTVRELLGHSSLEMTLRYAHLAPAHKAAAIARLDE
jgi:integrase